MTSTAIHHFHIPVMGLAFTIDSPIKVAHFGINSTISIIQDNLLEIARQYYYERLNEKYIPISQGQQNYRVKRVTDYLNLVNRIVRKNFESLKSSAFEAGSDIVKYFEMLPDCSTLKHKYLEMLHSNDEEVKQMLEKYLRKYMRPGSIEVNIMTKLDKNNYDKEGNLLENGSDAVTALRGYAESELTNSSIVFSAGLNPRLYNYLESLSEFDARGWGEFDKKVIIKVSDYRSALIQGKYLAKKGIWVSEFRIESGLNCGGHAFATDGMLMGPILEEFKNKKNELIQSQHEVYEAAMKEKGKTVYDKPHPINITVQGGIGTNEEHNFLRKHYNITSTGWGTPFLLCPEATTVDGETLGVLSKSKEKDVVLSKSSPLGVRFNYLKGTSGETERLERIANKLPGSPCTEKFLMFNTEFTEEPICTASRKYQGYKLKQLASAGLTEREYEKQKEEVLSKECLCVGLSNSASYEYEIPLVSRLQSVTICPGPNIAYFSKVASLKEMADHIYGRESLPVDDNRPHMFIKELNLYVDYLKEQIEDGGLPDAKTMKGYVKFAQNLIDGIAYYRDVLRTNSESFSDYFEVNEALDKAETDIEELMEANTLVLG